VDAQMKMTDHHRKLVRLDFVSDLASAEGNQIASLLSLYYICVFMRGVRNRKKLALLPFYHVFPSHLVG
jgi:hypothetical protein